MADELKDAPEYMDYSRRALRTARLAFDDGDWVGAINRAYYAIFYAANAVLELEGLERSKHSGVLALFRQRYIKTGIIEPEFSVIYGKAFESRSEGDYERAKFPSQADAVQAIEGARRFVERIEQFLKGRQ
jgi:uncharacterized protein (UPF0332 family)